MSESRSGGPKRYMPMERIAKRKEEALKQKLKDIREGRFDIEDFGLFAKQNSPMQQSPVTQEIKINNEEGEKDAFNREQQKSDCLSCLSKNKCT